MHGTIPRCKRSQSQRIHLARNLLTNCAGGPGHGDDHATTKPIGFKARLAHSRVSAPGRNGSSRCMQRLRLLAGHGSAAHRATTRKWHRRRLGVPATDRASGRGRGDLASFQTPWAPRQEKARCTHQNRRERSLRYPGSQGVVRCTAQRGLASRLQSGHLRHRIAARSGRR